MDVVGRYGHEKFGEFVVELVSKLDRGREEYGQPSLSMPPEKLIAEMRAECLDIAGWGWLLWLRLTRMEEALRLAAPSEEKQ